MAAGLQKKFGMIGRLFAQTSVLRGVVICTVFASVLSVGTYVASDQFGLFQLLVHGSGNGFGSAGDGAQVAPPTGAASLDPSDPVKNFARTGIGHVLFTAPSTDNCRRNLFDNRTGSSYEAGEVNCNRPPEAQNERLQSMSKPFKR
jgi:hypothetical protein